MADLHKAYFSTVMELLSEMRSEGAEWEQIRDLLDKAIYETQANEEEAYWYPRQQTGPDAWKGGFAENH